MAPRLSAAHRDWYRALPDPVVDAVGVRQLVGPAPILLGGLGTALATAGLAAWRAADSRSLVVVPFLAGAVYALAIGIFLLGAEVFAPTVATGCFEHTEATGGFGDFVCYGPLPIVSTDALSAAKHALRTGGTYTLYSIPLVLLAHGIGRLMRAPAAEPVAAPDAPRR